MKTKIAILLILLLTTISFGQNTETVNESEPMPFNLAEIPPLAPDCKAKWKIEKQQKCTRNYILNHINRKINTNLISEIGLTGIVRIDVTFTIDKEGNPKNIIATGGPEVLNQDAIEVIQRLPQLTPAINKGEVVEVYLKFPIAFDIQ